MKTRNEMIEELKVLRKEFLVKHCSHMGVMSRIEMKDSLRIAGLRAISLFDPTKGRFQDYVRGAFHKVLTEFLSRYSYKKLSAERKDCDLIKGALASEEGLIKYLDYWKGVLAKNAFFGKWTIRGLSVEQAREELLFSLIEDILGRKPGMMNKKRTFDHIESFAKPGAEATYLFLFKQKDKLRERFSPTKKWNKGKHQLDLDFGSLSYPEELLINKEARFYLVETFERTQLKLSRPQLSWFNAFEKHGEKCSFSSGRINPSKIARVLEKDPHSASKALKSIRVAVKKSLSKEAREIIL